MHRELLVSGPEHRPVGSDLERMPSPPVVEPRGTLAHEPHLTANHPRHPDQPTVVRLHPSVWHGHRRLEAVTLDYLFLDASLFRVHPGSPAEPVLAA
jgi:hypothetical protein